MISQIHTLQEGCDIVIPEHLKEDHLLKSFQDNIPDKAKRDVVIRLWLAHLSDVDKATEPARLSQFEDAVKDTLHDLILDTAKKNGLSEQSLAGRRFDITFPNGKPTVMISEKPAPREDKKGSGRLPNIRPSFNHGKVHFEGKTYNSLSDFCDKTHLQYEQRPNALECVLDPWELETKHPCLFRYEVKSRDQRPVHYVPPDIRAGRKRGLIKDDKDSVVKEFFLIKVAR